MPEPITNWKEAKEEWSRMTMSLKVTSFPLRRFDKLTPEVKRDAHERYEIMCADIDRRKS